MILKLTLCKISLSGYTYYSLIAKNIGRRSVVTPSLKYLMNYSDLSNISYFMQHPQGNTTIPEELCTIEVDSNNLPEEFI